MSDRPTEFIILVTTALLVVVSGAYLVLQVGWQSLLPPQRWRKLPNLGSYCWAIFLIFWGTTPFVAQALLKSGLPLVDKPVVAGVVASVAVFPMQMLAVIWAGWFFLGAIWRIGLPPRQQIWAAVAAGFVTWFAVYPPTQAVNLVVREVVNRWAEGPKISTHQLITELRKPENSSLLWMLITIESVFLAPIREELFFRGAVQTWLIRQPFGGWVGLAIAAFAGVTMRGEVVGFWNRRAPLFFVLFMGVALFLLQPLLARFRDRLGLLGEYIAPRIHAGQQAGRQVYQGIIGASIMFAMFHSSSWPDPIPLSILGLGLGWLAWRTHSVIGSIVCHSLFNAMTIFQLRFLLPSS